MSADRTRLSDATLQSQFTQTATALQTFSAASSVSAQFTQTAQAIKNVLSDATLSSVFSIDPVPQSVQLAEADLFSNQSNLTWDEMGTWEEPLQEYWAPNFVVEGELIAGGRTLPTGIFSQTIDPTIVWGPTIAFTGVFAPTLTVTKTGFLQATPSSQFTASITAIKTAVGESDQTGVFTTTPTAIKTTRITDQFTAQATVTPTAVKTTRTGATPNAEFTTNGVLPPTRIRYSDASLSTAFTIQTLEALTVAFGVATPPSQFTVTVTADRIRLGINEVYISIASVADVDPTIIWGPTITFQSVASILSLGLGYAIDPWRALPIKSETRINKIEQETRTYMIPSETRILKFQPGVNTRIVDQAGILDRREG